MRTFRDIALDEAKYNYDVDSKANPYLDLDKAKLKKKQSSFQTQIDDLRSKVRRSNMGGSGDKNGYFSEIETYELKLAQVKAALKGK